MNHFIKQNAVKFILQFSRWNNDTKQYDQMYSMAWTLLIIIGLWASLNAGKADFSVLYGNHFNLHNTPWKARLYAFSIALFIQCLIVIPGGVVAKILVNKLHIGESKKRHIFQLLYLSPILLAGLAWSTHLSLNIGQAVRAETKDEYYGQLNDLQLKLFEKDSAIAEIQDNQSQGFKKDSTLLAQEYHGKRQAQRAKIDATIDSLEREAVRLSRVKAGWAKATVKKIRNQKVPALRHQYEQYFSQNQSQLKKEIRLLKSKYDTLYQPDIQLKRMVYDTINKKYMAQLGLLEEDIDFTTRKRRAMSIVYNCLALLIVFGAHEVYKNINADEDTQLTHNPLGYTTYTNLTHPTHTPIDLVTQGTQAHTNPIHIVHKVDINKLRNNITGTYYPRCFLKNEVGERGSSNLAYANRNKRKVLQMIEQLEQYGVRTEINFDQFEQVKFHDDGTV